MGWMLLTVALAGGLIGIVHLALSMASRGRRPDATTGTPEAETRALWAVTMELPAAGGGSSSRTLMLLGVGQ